MSSASRFAPITALRAHLADERALGTARRSKIAKLAKLADNLRLRAEVELRLQAHWSAQQIAVRLAAGERHARATYQHVQPGTQAEAAATFAGLVDEAE